ncbi:MAG: hypothetical protein WCO84_00945 [bacterium]
MKFKTTKKAIKDNYYRILSVPYCELQNLLRYENPIAYSSGSYGWACDYYYVDGVLISTGYSTINSKNVKQEYDIMELYEKQARSINSKFSPTAKQETTELLYKFISQVKGE